MKKSELIAELQKIPGNPLVGCFNNKGDLVEVEYIQSVVEAQEMLGKKSVWGKLCKRLLNK